MSEQAAKAKANAGEGANGEGQHTDRTGFLQGLGCYLLWGVMPVYWKLLSAVPAFTRKEKAEKKRVLLEGDLPTPYNPPEGCRFAGRCPYAKDACREGVATEDLGDGHTVMCLRAKELN